jgi:hypothetical protein
LDVPFARIASGHRYFTYAGYTTNRALGVFFGHASFTASDAYLDVRSPLDWGSVPAHPDCFAPLWPQIYEGGSDRSMYQLLLPVELQMAEIQEAWRQDQTTIAVLERLRRSKALEISPGVQFPLC